MQELGFVWPGTEPVASAKLEKIGFKRICEGVGAPTPPFTVLSEEDAAMCVCMYVYIYIYIYYHMI